VVQHGFLFGVSKSGSGLGALNYLSGVGLIGEYTIYLVAEGVVVNEVGSSSFVLGNERVNLDLGEFDLEGAEAGAELDGYRRFNLQQLLRRFLCVIYRSPGRIL
jgi:hypothetical protein